MTNQRKNATNSKKNIDVDRKGQYTSLLFFTPSLWDLVVKQRLKKMEQQGGDMSHDIAVF